MPIIIQKMNEIGSKANNLVTLAYVISSTAKSIPIFGKRNSNHEANANAASFFVKHSFMKTNPFFRVVLVGEKTRDGRPASSSDYTTTSVQLSITRRIVLRGFTLLTMCLIQLMMLERVVVVSHQRRLTPFWPLFFVQSYCSLVLGIKITSGSTLIIE